MRPHPGPLPGGEGGLRLDLGVGIETVEVLEDAGPHSGGEGGLRLDLGVGIEKVEVLEDAGPHSGGVPIRCAIGI